MVEHTLTPFEEASSVDIEDYKEGYYTAWEGLPQNSCRGEWYDMGYGVAYSWQQVLDSVTGV